MVLIAAGALAYGLTLVATLPARLMLPLPDATGTVWRGASPLPGGDTLSWRWAPLRSLVNLGFAVDWEIKGARSDLAGGLVLGSDWTRLDAVGGRIDAAVLRFALPALPFRCALVAQVNLKQVKYGGGGQMVDGEILSDAGACRASTTPAWVPVPPLAFTTRPLGKVSGFTLAPQGQRRRTLMTGSLSPDGALSIAVTREGGAMLPFASPPTGLTLATDL